MAEKIMIMGESGTGKSTSIRNCDPAMTAIVNPVGKPLPFRGSKRFATLNGETDSDEICEFMKTQAKAGKKIIIVDDFQYILAIPYMSRIKENGWDKWNDFGENYFKIIDVCKELPEDVCVYYLTHCETLENGLTTVKLIGKLLREKITIEGLFTIVLKTGVSEGKYYFFTQNSGKDTVKSPMGMFDTFSVDNDLSYIDAKIRNYYEFDHAISDSAMAKLDEEKAGDVEKSEPRRRRNANEKEAVEETVGRTKRRSSKKREEIIASNQQKFDEYVKAYDDAVNDAAKKTGLKEGGDVPFDAVVPPEAPALDSVPRRTLEEQDDIDDINKKIAESGEALEKSAKSIRRTRKSRG